MSKKRCKITGFVDMGSLAVGKRANVTIAIAGVNRMVQTSPVIYYYAGSGGIYIETKNTIYYA